MTQTLTYDTSLDSRHKFMQKVNRWLIYGLLIGGMLVFMLPYLFQLMQSLVY